MAGATGDAPRVKFGRVTPVVSVRDIEIALSFYRDVLGFDVVFQNGDPVRFVILSRDEAEIDLALNPQHQATPENVAFMNVDNANALYQSCLRNGVAIIKGIRDADYGLRTFVMADPDGNRIDVGQTLA